MSQLELPEDLTARIVISAVGGDLRLRGWERSMVAARDESTEIMPGEDGTVQIVSSSDMNLYVPASADVDIQNVGADAKITGIEGELNIGNVGGDLTVRNSGPVTINNVGSDLRLKRIAGHATINHASADVTIREIEGDTTIGNVGSDLYVRDLNGTCTVESVGADLVLSTDFVDGGVYQFHVGGDIVCRIPADASVRFRVGKEAEVSIDAPDSDLIEGEDFDEIVFGEGAALVELRAGADIRLVGQEEDYMMAINLQLEGELAARLDGIEERLTEQLAGLDELLTEKAERLRVQAEQQAERAIRKTERALNKADRKMKRKRGFTLSFGGGTRTVRPPRQPEPPEPVSDEERLMILRMLENKQISVEEAEKLLAALER